MKYIVTMLIVLATSIVVQGNLLHRYSFDGNCNDSVGTAHGTLVNKTGLANYNNGQVVFGQKARQKLSGDPTTQLAQGDYVDLPNGLLKEAATTGENHITFEAWVTLDANDSTTYATGSTNLFYFGQVGGASGVAPEDKAPVWAGVYENHTNTRYIYAPMIGRIPGAGVTQARAGYMHWQDDGLSANGQVTLFNRNDFPYTQPGTIQVHFVCTYSYDKTTSELDARIYVNGVLEQRTTTAPVGDISAWPTDINGWLGRSPWGDHYQMAGKIHEFRIYNHVLSDDEITTNYAVGPDVLCTGKPDGDINHDCMVDLKDFALMASSWLNVKEAFPGLSDLAVRYEFNETEGTTIEDTGPLGRDATLVKFTGYDIEQRDGFLWLRNDSTAIAELGSYVKLPSHILQDPNHPELSTGATIEAFVGISYDVGRWDATLFWMGRGDDPNENSGYNPFIKFTNYLETPYANESCQTWWHQSAQWHEQNQYFRPAIHHLPVKKYVAVTIEENIMISELEKDRVATYIDGTLTTPISGTNPKIMDPWNGPGINTAYNYASRDGFEDLVNYLGRGCYSGNKAHVRFYEFRVWKKALTAAQVARSFASGPDQLPECLSSDAADITQDCVVNEDDLAALATDWLVDNRP